MSVLCVSAAMLTAPQHTAPRYTHLDQRLVLERDLAIVADLPERGSEAPLVSSHAQVLGVLHTLRGDPGDPLDALWGETGRGSAGPRTLLPLASLALLVWLLGWGQSFTTDLKRVQPQEQEGTPEVPWGRGQGYTGTERLKEEKAGGQAHPEALTPHGAASDRYSQH